MPNRQIVQTVCSLLDELRPDLVGPHDRLITYVSDRPATTGAYAIDARKIEHELAGARQSRLPPESARPCSGT